MLPFAPDAWIDHDKTKTGYEIPFTKEFFVYRAPRPMADIDTELGKETKEILALIEAMSK